MAPIAASTGWLARAAEPCMQTSIIALSGTRWDIDYPDASTDSFHRRTPRRLFAISKSIYASRTRTVDYVLQRANNGPAKGS